MKSKNNKEMKTRNPLVAMILNAVGSIAATGGGGWRMPKKGGRDKSNLPQGYPGAKMARKAVMGRLGVTHLGMRADHTPSR